MKYDEIYKTIQQFNGEETLKHCKTTWRWISDADCLIYIMFIVFNCNGMILVMRKPYGHQRDQQAAEESERENTKNERQIQTKHSQSQSQSHIHKYI